MTRARRLSQRESRRRRRLCRRTGPRRPISCASCATSWHVAARRSGRTGIRCAHFRIAYRSLPSPAVACRYLQSPTVTSRLRPVTYLGQVLQLEAEAELLARQLGASQDQQVWRDLNPMNARHTLTYRALPLPAVTRRCGSIWRRNSPPPHRSSPTPRGALAAPDPTPIPPGVVCSTHPAARTSCLALPRYHQPASGSRDRDPSSQALRPSQESCRYMTVT